MARLTSEGASTACPNRHAQEVEALFPGVDAKSVLIVPTCQHAKVDLARVGEPVEQEKDALLERFVRWAKHVCDALERRGCWVDYVDPCSGLPMVHREHAHRVYGEVDALTTLLGYVTTNSGCCKIVLHPWEGLADDELEACERDEGIRTVVSVAYLAVSVAATLAHAHAARADVPGGVARWHLVANCMILAVLEARGCALVGGGGLDWSKVDLEEYMKKTAIWNLIVSFPITWMTGPHQPLTFWPGWLLSLLGASSGIFFLLACKYADMEGQQLVDMRHSSRKC
eukprot:jgi/Pico_ML_1/51208/g2283.t2